VSCLVMTIHLCMVMTIAQRLDESIHKCMVQLWVIG